MYGSAVSNVTHKMNAKRRTPEEVGRDFITKVLPRLMYPDNLSKPIIFCSPEQYTYMKNQMILNTQVKFDQNNN